MSGSEQSKPRGILESKIHAIWSQTLGGGGHLARDRSIFDFGASSIDIMRFVETARRELWHDLDEALVMQFSSVEQLAAALQRRIVGGGATLIHFANQGSSPIVVAAPSRGTALTYLELARDLRGCADLCGLELPGLYGERAMPDTTEQIAQGFARVLSEARVPRELTLLGYSFGCILAFETARLLCDEIGVDHLVLIAPPAVARAGDVEAFDGAQFWASRFEGIVDIGVADLHGLTRTAMAQHVADRLQHVELPEQLRHFQLANAAHLLLVEELAHRLGAEYQPRMATSVPTLVIQPGAETLGDLATVKRGWAAALPNSYWTSLPFYHREMLASQTSRRRIAQLICSAACGEL